VCKIVTKRDFIDILSENEYKSFGRFLITDVHPIGEKMITINCKSKKYNSMLISINTYSISDILSTALERIGCPRTTSLRTRTLHKIIEYLKDKERETNDKQ